MNPQLSKDILVLRSKFLFALRSFFAEREFLEVDTPKLKRVPGMEPYLTPFSVSDPSGKELGYLVTSPEYSLKQALSLGMSKIYEISQVYRSGERGTLHSAEFLMLEFYISGMDEQALMDVCTELFLYLDQKFISIGFQDNPPQKKGSRISLRNWEFQTPERICFCISRKRVGVGAWERTLPMKTYFFWSS